MSESESNTYICKATGWTFMACKAFRALNKGDCLAKHYRTGSHPDSMRSHIQDGDMSNDDARLNAQTLPVCERVKP